MRVAVVEAGDYPPSAKIDNVGIAVRQPHDLIGGAGCFDQPVADGDGFGLRGGLVKGGDPSVQQDCIRHLIPLPLFHAV